MGFLGASELSKQRVSMRLTVSHEMAKKKSLGVKIEQLLLLVVKKS